MAKHQEEERPLSNEEIEAILAAEAEHIPEADAEPPELNVVKKEPGQRAWVAWLLIIFILVGAMSMWKPNP